MPHLFVSLDAVRDLSIPSSAITDGSTAPTWVELPYRNGYVYGRTPALRLPFDAATAGVVRRWLRFDRRRRTFWTPLELVLLSAALLLLIFVDDDRADWVRLALFVAATLIQLTRMHLEKKLTVAQHPELIGRLGVYLPAVSAPVAAEWVRRNPAVRVVTERPQWRRFSSMVYRWAAGSFAVAGAGVWWFALRDGEFELVAALGFAVLFGAAVVAAVKALPVGFVRFGETPGHR